jgi:hypothetical protein
MKNFKLLLVVLVVMTSISSAFAKKNPWRECGIGGMLFKETGWAAVLSNVIWDLGTTASSSTSSSEHLCEGKSASVAKFIHESYAVIEEETVKGQGTHLVTMLDTLGCDSNSHPAIINAVRADLSNTLSHDSYVGLTHTQKAQSYYSNVMNNVQGKCQLI